ncbi:hypothetical protein LV779_36720 [Streptomyces thinghirensis]|nr:hypothetical protein [Streptomyces thinghirensis]
MHRTSTTPPSGPTAAPSAAPVPGPSLPETQKRILVILLASQVLSGVGLAAACHRCRPAGSGHAPLPPPWPGCPAPCSPQGSALAAVIIGRVSQTAGVAPAGRRLPRRRPRRCRSRRSRRPRQPCPAVHLLFLYGAGTAANLQARYAGADLAAPRHRARALSTVLVAPPPWAASSAPTSPPPPDTSPPPLALPPLTGLFLISSAAFALAALTLLIWLRPDPPARPHSPHRAGDTERTCPEPAPDVPRTTAPPPQLPLGVLVDGVSPNSSWSRS